MDDEQKYQNTIDDFESDIEEPTPTPDKNDWTYKDIDSFYERVRIALGAVTDTTLPDKYMDYPEKAPFAEAYVKNRVKNWSELPDNKFSIFESIIVYETAVLFQSIVSNRRIKKKEIPTIKLEYSDKYNDLIGDMSLADMVEYLIASLNEEETDIISFFGFRVTDNVFKQKGNCCGRTFIC